VNRFNLSHLDCINYLYNIYIMNYRRCFIKCYINQMLHFDITMMSCDESFYAMLKQQLSKFIDNLKTVINNINFMFINEF
jgi:hypothetical protein